MQYEIRPMGVGGILDQTFRLLKNHFGMLAGIVGVLYVPLLVIQQGGLVWAGASTNIWSALKNLGQTSPSLGPRQIVGGAVAYVAGMLSILAMPLTSAAIIRGVAAQYLGEKVTAGRAFRDGLRHLFPILGTGLLAGIFIMFGGLAFLVPGIYLAMRFWLRNNAIVVEGAGPMDALKRSGALMKGHYGKAFVLFLLLLVITGAAQGAGAFIPVEGVAIPLRVIGQAFALLLNSIAGVVFYFSSRAGLENFDLTVLAQAVGREETPPQTPSAG
jgi:hypothetical protein